MAVIYVPVLTYPQYEKYHTIFFVVVVIKPEQLQVGKQLYLQTMYLLL